MSRTALYKIQAGGGASIGTSTSLALTGVLQRTPERLRP